MVNSTGQPFNDAYRYVDWLLTVPLLLIELILVMQLPAEESSRKMWTLGAASGFMVAFGYPGEVRDDPAGRWFYWAVSMCPFMYVLYELYFGLAEATKKHAPSVASLIASARYITAISWLTYPFVSAAREGQVAGVRLGSCGREGARARGWVRAWHAWPEWKVVCGRVARVLTGGFAARKVVRASGGIGAAERSAWRVVAGIRGR